MADDRAAHEPDDLTSSGAMRRACLYGWKSPDAVLSPVVPWCHAEVRAFTSGNDGHAVKDGNGLAASLWTEAKRSAQRAIASFFSNERQPFVIDAFAATEYLAKLRIVERDPFGLYTARRQEGLNSAQRYIIETPWTVTSRPTPEVFEQALRDLVNVPTIGAEAVFDLVNGPGHLDGAIDLADATSLRDARNRGIHLGEFPHDPSDLASAFLSVVNALTSDRKHARTELWGIWPRVVTPAHLTTARTATAEAEIRYCRSRWTWLHRPTEISRLSSFRLHQECRTMACPSCGNQAGLTSMLGQSAPRICVEIDELATGIDVMDCLHCNLTLFGRQIRTAQQLVPPPAQTFEMAHPEFFR